MEMLSEPHGPKERTPDYGIQSSKVIQLIVMNPFIQNMVAYIKCTGLYTTLPKLSQHGEQNDTTKLHTPIKFLKLIENKEGRKKPTIDMPKKTDLPFLYVKDLNANITLRELTLNRHLQNTNTAKILFNDELEELLGLDTLNQATKEIYKNRVKSFFNKETKLKDIDLNILRKSPIDFLKFSSGSKDVRQLLQQNNTTPGTSTTWFKIRKEWKLDDKKRPKYIENTVDIWKNNILPASLQTLHLKLLNNNLKTNNQTKHFPQTNDLSKEENGRCTFCNITKTTQNGTYAKETYKHLFLECKTTVKIINYCTEVFKVSRPNLKKNGELVLYNFNHKDKLENLKLNIFFLLLKQYILNCKYGKRLPTNSGAENHIRHNIRLIIICNKTNNNLMHNLISLWTGHEIYEAALPDVLQDTMGNSILGRIFQDSNKRHFILQRRLNDTFALPYAEDNSYIINHSYCHLNKLTNTL